jgi:hypothetical protein
MPLLRKRNGRSGVISVMFCLVSGLLRFRNIHFRLHHKIDDLQRFVTSLLNASEHRMLLKNAVKSRAPQCSRNYGGSAVLRPRSATPLQPRQTYDTRVAGSKNRLLPALKTGPLTVAKESQVTQRGSEGI